MPLGSALALLLARAATEALPFALLLVLLGAPLGGALALQPAWLGAAGALALLGGVAVTVDRPRARLLAAAFTIGASLGVAWLTSDRGLGAASLASRGVAATLAAGVLLWRGLAIPGSAQGWRPMAFASLAATLAAAAASLHPVARNELPPVALAVGALGAVGLSLARGSEELFAERRRGRVRMRHAGALVALVGLAALAAVAGAPLLRRVAEALAPVLESLLFAALVLVVTPFAYLAEWLVPAILAIAQALQRVGMQLRLPEFGPARDPLAEEEYARQLAVQAELFLRALGILVLGSVLAYLALRYLFSRSVELPAGASFERSDISGMGLGELLRRIRRAAQARPLRPAGADPAARIRRAYWDLLALAERGGARWRARHETPREHLASLGGEPWSAAAALVEAFERVRYGDRASEADAATAERALARVERAVTQRV